MNKIKTISIYLLIVLFFSIALILLKIKNKEELKHKAVLAQEHLMLDLRAGHEESLQDVPVDGLWHARRAVNIGELRVRRQRAAPDILEIQIESKNDPSVVSNLRIRMNQ